MKRFLLIPLLCLLPLACERGKDNTPDKADPSGKTPNPDKTGDPAQAPAPEIGQELSKVAGVSIKLARPLKKGDVPTSESQTGKLSVKSRPLRKALSLAFPKDIRFIDEAGILDALYDVEVQPQSNSTAAWRKVQKAVSQAFGVKFSPDNIEMDVYVLRSGDAPPAGLTKPERESDERWIPLVGDDDAGFRVIGGTMPLLAYRLEGWLARPVLDETHLAGGYDFHLAMDHANPPTVKAGVEKLGLQLIEAKRHLDVILVRKSQE